MHKIILISLLFLGVAAGQTSVTYYQAVDLPGLVAPGTYIVWSATGATFTNSRFCFQLSDASLPSGVTVLKAPCVQRSTGPQLAVTDAVTNGSTTVTSATASFTSDMINRNAFLGGGNAAFLFGVSYRITGVIDSHTITVDNCQGCFGEGSTQGLRTGTGATLYVGGLEFVIPGTFTFGGKTYVPWDVTGFNRTCQVPGSCASASRGAYFTTDATPFVWPYFFQPSSGDFITTF